MLNKRYSYVGHVNIADLPSDNQRVWVRSSQDILQWIKTTNQQPEYDDVYIATFIVDTDGLLWINDRRSEHVLCANGQDVLCAGEIGFVINDSQLEIIELSNQSTGYCPEPKSWYAIHHALQTAQISHPDFFTLAITFRLCDVCHTKNIVNDHHFYCANCDASLPLEWNFG